MASGNDIILEWAPLATCIARPHLLTDAERDRWARMATGPGERWAAGRTWVRERLGAQLGTSPAAVPLGAEPTGRPVLLDGAAHLSISHTDRVIVLALAPAPVGVDVEGLPPANEDLLSLDRLVGSPAEVAELRTIDPAARPRAFQRWWVAKEAVLKAIGSGFLADARDVEIGVLTPRAPDPMYLHEVGALLGNDICATTTSSNNSVLRVATA